MTNKVGRAGIFSAAILLQASGFITPAHAQAQEELFRKVEGLEQELRVLKRQLEIDKEASDEKAKSAPVVTAGSSGFAIQSANQDFTLKVRGYIQADGRFYPDDHPAGTANDSFLLRRVRPIIEGTVFDKHDYRLMLDFGSGITASSANNSYLQDAYWNARFWPGFQVRAGKFKEPVGLERLQSATSLLFVERSYPTQLLPNRDAGVMAHGAFLEGALNYQLGVFNGVADGGSGDIETSDDDKDIAARVFAEPFINSDWQAIRGLGFGLAGTYGNHEGAPRAYSSPGQQRFFAFRSGSGSAAAPNVSADGTSWRIAPQFYYYHGPFGLLGEYAISSQELRRDDGAASFATIQNSAWQLAASYVLTGEKASFRSVVPRRPFAIGGEGWGAWEAAARVSGLDVDDDAFPAFANPASSASGAFSWALGLSWHLNKNFKLQLNYEQTDFSGGTAPLLENGEKVVLTRGQISF